LQFSNKTKNELAKKNARKFECRTTRWITLKTLFTLIMTSPMATTNVTDGKFVFLSYQLPSAFDTAHIGYTDLSGGQQTWTINSWQPNSVNTQPNLAAITSVSLSLRGQPVTQFNLTPGPGYCWPTAQLPNTGNCYITWSPNTQAVIIMDEDVIGPNL
jgi:hypothetical protein